MSEGILDGAPDAFLTQRLVQCWVSVPCDQVRDLTWVEFALMDDLGTETRRPEQTALGWVTVDCVDGAVDAGRGSAEIGLGGGFGFGSVGRNLRRF